jgi:hypothetical protein
MTRRAWGLLILLAVMVVAAPFARAQSVDMVTAKFLTGYSPVAGGGYVRTVNAYADPVTARIWAAAGGNTILASDSVALTARAGSMAIQSKASVSLSNAAKAVARCIFGGGLICGAASVAAAVYAGYRIYHDDDIAGENLRFDPGIPPSETIVWRMNCSGASVGSQTGPSATVVANAVCAASAAALSQGAYSYAAPSMSCTVDGNNASCTGQSTVTYTPPNGDPATQQTQDWTSNGNTEIGYVCPAVADPNPRFARSAGAAPDADGKCRSPRSSHQAVTDEIARQKVEAFPPVWGSGEGGDFAGSGAAGSWAEALKQSVDQGGQTAPATIETTGPAQQVGQQTSTTTTDSTTSPPTTTTTTTTPTHNYTYNGPNINVSTTNVTTTNNGTTTTTTTTTNGTPGEEKPDPCIANPGRAGCAQLGTPPTDKPESVDKPITYTPENVGPSGSCPPDRIFMFSGWALPLHYQPACDAAPFARLAILLLVTISSMGLIVRTVST